MSSPDTFNAAPAGPGAAGRRDLPAGQGRRHHDRAHAIHGRDLLWCACSPARPLMCLRLASLPARQVVASATEPCVNIPSAVSVLRLSSGFCCAAQHILSMLSTLLCAAGSAELIAVSSLFTYDIYRTYIKPNAPPKQTILVSAQKAAAVNQHFSQSSSASPPACTAVCHLSFDFAVMRVALRPRLSTCMLTGVPHMRRRLWTSDGSPRCPAECRRCLTRLGLPRHGELKSAWIGVCNHH